VQTEIKEVASFLIIIALLTISLQTRVFLYSRRIPEKTVYCTYTNCKYSTLFSLCQIFSYSFFCVQQVFAGLTILTQSNFCCHCCLLLWLTTL